MSNVIVILQYHEVKTFIDNFKDVCVNIKIKLIFF